MPLKEEREKEGYFLPLTGWPGYRQERKKEGTGAAL